VTRRRRRPPGSGRAGRRSCRRSWRGRAGRSRVPLAPAARRVECHNGRIPCDSPGLVALARGFTNAGGIHSRRRGECRAAAAARRRVCGACHFAKRATPRRRRLAARPGHRPSTRPTRSSCATRRRSDGHPHLSLLVTRDQRAGRGRLDHVWTAPPGTALAVSVLLRVGAVAVPIAAGSRSSPVRRWCRRGAAARRDGRAEVAERRARRCGPQRARSAASSPRSCRPTRTPSSSAPASTRRCRGGPARADGDLVRRPRGDATRTACSPTSSRAARRHRRPRRRGAPPSPIGHGHCSTLGADVAASLRAVRR
jgi:hypothetical protein